MRAGEYDPLHLDVAHFSNKSFKNTLLESCATTAYGSADNTSYVIVQLASVITGSTRVWVRERAAEKFSGIFHDPALGRSCLFEESRRIKGKNNLPERVKKIDLGNKGFKEFVEKPNIIAVVIAVLIIFLTIVFYLYRSIRSSANTILLVGLSDSGKTLIFGKIANKYNELTTYTSFQENILDIDVKGSHLKIVDFPGAERLRKQLTERWLIKERSSLRGIAFVVDSASFSKRSRDVAEFFYDVALESGKKVPIIVVCNKQDHGLAKSSQVIRDSLEREIALINKTRAAALASTDGSSLRTTLTDSGSGFSWKDLPITVDFLECSAVDGSSTGLEALRCWIKM
ncbi:GTP-binding domain protein [Dictyocaulus viviparus]|uniref:Signal recognition particle receptor subunit beta n=1 Tax=Dictyocaulus viviparus TaxID=29172 RepID=A0A0D8Y884_DICVI|nr:GTP-binding domain protein [Dictyocaulus viviparus]